MRGYGHSRTRSLGSEPRRNRARWTRICDTALRRPPIEPLVWRRGMMLPCGWRGARGTHHHLRRLPDGARHRRDQPRRISRRRRHRWVEAGRRHHLRWDGDRHQCDNPKAPPRTSEPSSCSSAGSPRHKRGRSASRTCPCRRPAPCAPRGRRQREKKPCGQPSCAGIPTSSTCRSSRQRTVTPSPMRSPM